MAKDTTTAVIEKPAGAAVAGARLPLRQLTRRALAPQPVEVVELPDLAPMMVRDRFAHPGRDPKLPKLADLAGRPKLILLAGPGGAGKTTMANVLASEWDTSGLLLGQALVAATDPGVVALAHFLPTGALHQPKSRSAQHAIELTELVLAEAEADDPPPVTLLDCGGGSTALASVLEKDPGVFARLDAKGVAVLMMWFWTPRLLDLALLKSFRAHGVKPTATAMVLNGAYAREGWEVYEPLRQQPVYQEVLAEGGAEVWMPALRQETALTIERRGILFRYAVEGRLPDWKAGKVHPVDGDAATETGLWLGEVREELAPIASWVRP